MSATNFVSNSNMTTIMTAIAEKLNAINGAYIARGSITFANIPASLTKAMTGYVYNITDAFTTDARFVEGAGKKYSAGTNIVVVNVGSASTPDMKLDAIANFVDVDAITARIDAVKNDLADTFSTSVDYVKNDIVVYQDTLYRFKAAHAKGAWSGSDVDAITVDALVSELLTAIATATPTELTTAEVNAIVALLN